MDGRETGERKIVFYCSASYDIDEKFNQAAREVTRAACSLGYTIVSGGAVKGTMGVLADEVVRCGGRHIGVLPRFMAQYRFPKLDDTVWTESMADRKEKMRSVLFSGDRVQKPYLIPYFAASFVKAATCLKESCFPADACFARESKKSLSL